MLRILTVTALFPLLTHASVLTCDVPGGTYYPRDHVYTASSSVTNTNASGNLFVFAVFSVGPLVYCSESNCIFDEISITDNKNTKYAAPSYVPGLSNNTQLRSPTPVPPGAVVSVSVTWRVAPSDGTTQYGTEQRLQTGTYTGTIPVANGNLVTIPGTNAVAATVSYQAPDQHDFGDLHSANTNGYPLILPPPQSGSLRANILWSGPPGTTMTGTTGTTPNAPVPQGVATPIDTAGQGLQVDLHSTENATPGPISGNLTLTLTCP